MTYQLSPQTRVRLTHGYEATREAGMAAFGPTCEGRRSK
jgi:hypothetical protein